MHHSWQKHLCRFEVFFIEPCGNDDHVGADMRVGDTRQCRREIARDQLSLCVDRVELTMHLDQFQRRFIFAPRVEQIDAGVFDLGVTVELLRERQHVAAAAAVAHSDFDDRIDVSPLDQLVDQTVRRRLAQPCHP